MKNGELLAKTLSDVLLTGEIPYQAVHNAAQAVDWFDDVATAEQELVRALDGIRTFVAGLEGFAGEAKFVERKALAALR